MSSKPRLDAATVKRATNLLDVVRRYVEMRRAGDGVWRGHCPFHSENTASFQVRERRQDWHCFGCGIHGDVLDFVMRAERCRLPEALERLGGMDLQPAPFPLWDARKPLAIPCEGKGCGRWLEVGPEDLCHLGRGLHNDWLFRGSGDELRGLCGACTLNRLAARMNSTDTQAVSGMPRLSAGSEACYRAGGLAGDVVPG